MPYDPTNPLRLPIKTTPNYLVITDIYNKLTIPTDTKTNIYTKIQGDYLNDSYTNDENLWPYIIIKEYYTKRPGTPAKNIEISITTSGATQSIPHIRIETKHPLTPSRNGYNHLESMQYINLANPTYFTELQEIINQLLAKPYTD